MRKIFEEGKKPGTFTIPKRRRSLLILQSEAQILANYAKRKKNANWLCAFHIIYIFRIVGKTSREAITMLWKDNPCNGCTEETGRNTHCHENCLRYYEWLVANDQRRENEKQESKKRAAIITPAYESMHRRAMQRKIQGRERK